MSKTKFTKGEWLTSRSKQMNVRTIAKLTDNLCIVSSACACEDPMFDATLIKTAPKLYAMIETLIENYQVAASIADHEGYETNYEQDKILVDFLLTEARGE